ncbi:MAG: hypothetical protein PWP24_244 [Clostridiales bacterium]|nr:hypothetical protein [Clostridiales bacterium]
MHDIGALTVKERDELIQMDVENPEPHCSLGSYMLESFEPFHAVAKIVFYHHWDYRRDLEFVPEKGSVPIEAYLLHVADRTDVLIDPSIPLLKQRKNVMERIQEKDGLLFHPQAVKAFEKAAQKDSFWLDIDNMTMEDVLNSAVSKEFSFDMSMDLMEQFAFTLSKIIDSRSRFTISHSFGVSEVAYCIATLMGYPEEKCREIRVAGLLHDMGKIAIPTEIIEKQGSLTAEEREDIQTHAYYTNLILQDMDGLGDIVDWASCHHENHDGTGYPKNLLEHNITEEMDIISYADIYMALSENRPYRHGLSQEEILDIMKKQFENKHGTIVFQILEKMCA